MSGKKSETSGFRARQGSLSVIVVDDHVHTREMLREMLQHAGMDVRACGSIQEALTAVVDRAPDAVLTDLALAGENGRELASALRGERSTSHIAVIAITGEVSPTPDVLRYVDAFLTKPIELSDLADIVTSLVDGVELARGARRAP